MSFPHLIFLRVYRTAEDFVGSWCSSSPGVGNEVFGAPGIAWRNPTLFPPSFQLVPLWTIHAKDQLHSFVPGNQSLSIKKKPPKASQEQQQWKGISEQETIHSQTHLGSGIIKPQFGTWAFFFRSSGYFS